jgi:hypothetical protein
LPTVIALAERVGSLATTLHGLDADVSATSVASLEQRLAALRAEAGDMPSPEQERRIALLERQQATIVELGGRRRVPRLATRERQPRAAEPASRSLEAPLVRIRERRCPT